LLASFLFNAEAIYKKMSYSDFNFSEIKNKFQLSFVEVTGVFSTYTSRNPEPWLISFLAQTIPLALAINTEKARSELIVAPLLLGLKNLFNGSISIFSGNDFTVDASLGLNGRIDFLISRSSEQLFIEAPVAIIVEAKNENLNGGIPQCIAELIAASRFNEQQGNKISPLYGAVTTGSLWKFLQLEGNTVTIDLNEYPLQPVEGIVGILAHLIEETK